MGLVLTATAGLIVWLILWAVGAASGFDSIMIGVAVFLLAIAVHGVLPYLPGRR
jgi:F0F1-type ATP synthase assembly protein I